MGKHNVGAGIPVPVATEANVAEVAEQAVVEVTAAEPVAEVLASEDEVTTVTTEDLAEAMQAMFALDTTPAVEPVEKVAKVKKESKGRTLKTTYLRKGATSDGQHEFGKEDFTDPNWSYRHPDSNQGTPKEGQLRVYTIAAKGKRLAFFQNEDARAFCDELNTGVEVDKWRYIGAKEIPEGKTAAQVWESLPDELKAKVARRKQG